MTEKQRQQQDRELRALLSETGAPIAGERKSVFVLPNGDLILKAESEVRGYIRRWQREQRQAG